jgi:cyclase
MTDSYRRGLHELGEGLYAYLQPDGSWGWSNAGLIVPGAGAGAGDQALLVDTLFDLALTQRMLDEMRRATAAAERIGVVVNTHANGDHCWGNQLVPGARIVASRAGAAEMAEVPPQMLAHMMRAAPSMGPLGAYLQRIFGAFQFDGIQLAPPTETFDGHLELRVGDRVVELYEVGPAHTRGDVMVHVPDARVVFTGDILFHEGHPVMWAGPVASWIAALDRILDLDVDVVVPGHGPLADKGGVRRLRDYFVHLDEETRKRHQAGLSWHEAAHDIARTAMGAYASWRDAERIMINVATLYRQLGATGVPTDVVALFGHMSQMTSELATALG